MFDNHDKSFKQQLRKTHVFPEDFGYTEGQHIYTFCALDRWAVIAEGLIVFQENREWKKVLSHWFNYANGPREEELVFMVESMWERPQSEEMSSKAKYNADNIGNIRNKLWYYLFKSNMSWKLI